jgi:hypothetical protein
VLWRGAVDTSKVAIVSMLLSLVSITWLEYTAMVHESNYQILKYN